MSIHTLSPSNPDLCVVYCEHVGDGVTMAAGGDGVAPAPLARPLNDDLLRPGSGLKCWQQAPVVYLMQTNGGATITVTFNSDVEGHAYLATRMAMIAPERGDPALGTVGQNNWYFGSFLSATLNGVTSSGAEDYNNNSPANHIYRGLDAWDIFRWCWFQDGQFGGGNPVSFPVRRGANTITIRQVGGLGQGGVHEAVLVRLATHVNHWHRPRRTRPGTGPSVNRLDALARLADNAGARPVRVLFVGDSLATRPDNWAVHFRLWLQGKFGDGGLTQKVGDLGLNAGQDNPGLAQWAYAGASSATQTAKTGGADYTGPLFDAVGYQWAQGQTGAVTYAYTGFGCELIYEQRPGGGSFAWSIDGGAATTVATAGGGAAGTYAKVTIPADYGNHTVTFVKAETAAAGGVGLFAFTFNADTRGVIGMRLSASGTAATEQFPASMAGAWQSFLAQYRPDLIVYGCVNNAAGGAADVYGIGDLGTYIKPIFAMLPTLVDTAGSAFVYCTLHRFSTGPFPTPEAYFGLVEVPHTEIGADVEDQVQRGLAPRPVTCLNYSAWIGYEDQELRQWNAGFYATTTDDGTTRTIVDFHTSAAGGQMLGTTLGKILTGDVGEPQSATDLYRTQLLEQIAFGGAGGGAAPTDGLTPVSHNTGGTDALRYAAGGVGVEGAAVRAYLKADYVAGVYTLRGQTTTGPDGRWDAPIYLAPARTYTLVFVKPGQFGPDVRDVTI